MKNRKPGKPFLFFLMMLLMCVLSFKSVKVTAAKASIKTLETDKTYKSYDITGDGKADKIRVTTTYDTSSSVHTGYFVKINGKKALSITGLREITPYCYSVDTKLVTLKNQNKYLVFRTTGENGDGTCIIYQYNDGILEKVKNVKNENYKSEYGSHFSVNSLYVTGNTITFKVYCMSYTLGSSYYKYKYTFRTGKLRRPETGTIYKCCQLKTSPSYKTYYSKTFKLKRSVKIYKHNSNKVISTLKKGTKIKAKKSSYSEDYGLEIFVKSGKKHGWIHAITDPSKPLFYNVQYAG